LALGPLDWAAEQFGAVDLGDRRLNKRVVTVAAAMAADPAGSIPKQNQASWAATKGAYRLFDHERATFEQLSQPHWQQTRRQCDEVGDGGGGGGGDDDSGVVLLIQDTTWLDYATHRNTSGLGWHGRSKKRRPRGGQGLFLHSVLAVEPHAHDSSRGRVLGLAWSTLWARTAAESIGKNQQQRSRRRRSDERESLRWSKAVTEIGSPSPSLAPSPIAAATTATTTTAAAPAQRRRRWLHVGDREADIFDLYRQTQAMSHVGFAVRVYRQRNASPGHDTPDTQTLEDRRGSDLTELCRAMPAFPQQQQQQLWVGPRGNQPGRWATLSVAGGPVTLWSPQLNRTGHALRCWAVRVWEANPPADCQAPVEWILLTSEPVRDLADALRIAGYYALRWLVEEYHNCLKSGCQVEQRQLETAARLEPLIAMLCAVAVRLLQLKNDARLTPDRPASACVPAELVQTLSALIEADSKSKSKSKSSSAAAAVAAAAAASSELTVRQFMHAVAKLGGFLGRKGDGEPGWRTLWRGWLELTLIHAGYELARKEGKGYG
jgi:hypothetical protein